MHYAYSLRRRRDPKVTLKSKISSKKELERNFELSKISDVINRPDMNESTLEVNTQVDQRRDDKVNLQLKLEKQFSNTRYPNSGLQKVHNNLLLAKVNLRGEGSIAVNAKDHPVCKSPPRFDSKSEIFDNNLATKNYNSNFSQRLKTIDRSCTENDSPNKKIIHFRHILHSDLAATRVRRPRRALDVKQIEMLYKSLAVSPFPSRQERIDLACKLNVTPRTVQVWFQNQRQKARNRNDIVCMETKNSNASLVAASVNSQSESSSSPKKETLSTVNHCIDPEIKVVMKKKDTGSIGAEIVCTPINTANIENSILCNTKVQIKRHMNSQLKSLISGYDVETESETDAIKHQQAKMNEANHSNVENNNLCGQEGFTQRKKRRVGRPSRADLPPKKPVVSLWTSLADNVKNKLEAEKNSNIVIDNVVRAPPNLLRKHHKMFKNDRTMLLAMNDRQKPKSMYHFPDFGTRFPSNQNFYPITSDQMTDAGIWNKNLNQGEISVETMDHFSRNSWTHPLLRHKDIGNMSMRRHTSSASESNDSFLNSSMSTENIIPVTTPNFQGMEKIKKSEQDGLPPVYQDETPNIGQVTKEHVGSLLVPSTVTNLESYSGHPQFETRKFNFFERSNFHSLSQTFPLNNSVDGWNIEHHQSDGPIEAINPWPPQSNLGLQLNSAPPSIIRHPNLTSIHRTNPPTRNPEQHFKHDRAENYPSDNDEKYSEPSLLYNASTFQMLNANEGERNLERLLEAINRAHGS